MIFNLKKITYLFKMANLYSVISLLLVLSIIGCRSEELHDEIGLSPRIVGGIEAIPHSFPYQVAIFLHVWSQPERLFCGGSLISEDFVLTAAHCVDTAINAEVILGAHNVFQVENTQQRFNSKVFIIHKQWNPSNLKNDIAIIRLPAKAKFTKEIQPITLPRLSDQGKSLVFKRVTVSGWGLTANKASNISEVLRFANSKVTVPLICKLLFFGNVDRNQICIDGTKTKSICSGDSGGPLVLVNKNNVPVQQGIVSFGIGLGCEAGWPQVFTKVSKYLKWIQERTGIPISK